jgi:hypothetical protein
MSAGQFAAPVVATAGSADPRAPLVVLLHGRGSHEREILSLTDRLPAGPAYAAVRAPIAEGGGFAWFANRGIGRPVAESLAATTAWFRAWLDETAPRCPGPFRRSSSRTTPPRRSRHACSSASARSPASPCGSRPSRCRAPGPCCSAPRPAARWTPSSVVATRR